MSEWRKYFTQLKGNVPPVARSDAEWRGTNMKLSLEGYKYKGRACTEFIWGEKVGKRSDIMGYVHLHSLCCPDRKKLEPKVPEHL